MQLVAAIIEHDIILAKSSTEFSEMFVIYNIVCQWFFSIKGLRNKARITGIRSLRGYPKKSHVSIGNPCKAKCNIAT